MLWLEIGIVEIDYCLLEVLCVSNEVWEIGGNEIGSIHFHLSVVFEPYLDMCCSNWYKAN